MQEKSEALLSLEELKRDMERMKEMGEQSELGKEESRNELNSQLEDAKAKLSDSQTLVKKLQDDIGNHEQQEEVRIVQ